jgi:hypothetical protein
MFGFFGNKPTIPVSTDESDEAKREKIVEKLCENRKLLEWQLTNNLEMKDDERARCETSLSDAMEKMNAFGITDLEYQSYLAKHPDLA